MARSCKISRVCSFILVIKQNYDLEVLLIKNFYFIIPDVQNLIKSYLVRNIFKNLIKNVILILYAYIFCCSFFLILASLNKFMLRKNH